MEIMIPVWRDSVVDRIADSDLGTLRGVEVALVDDNLDPVYTNEVERLLVADYGAVVKKFVKPLGTAPSPKSLIEDASKCRVAVIGMAM